MTGTIAPTILHELLSIVGKSAPLLGSILGSPLAGIGISLLSSYLNLPNDPRKIIDSLSSDPNTEVKLKQLEYDHAESLQSLKNQAFSIETNDMANARAAQIQIRSWVPTFLAVGFMLCYSCIQFYMVTHINSADDVISARFQDILIMIMSYYFGSSHQEAAK